MLIVLKKDGCFNCDLLSDELKNKNIDYIGETVREFPIVIDNTNNSVYSGIARINRFLREAGDRQVL